MNNWLSLVTTLPTENATVRQRAWRALKSSGAAVLRDGVYVMPERDDCRATLDAVQPGRPDGLEALLALDARSRAAAEQAVRRCPA